VVDVGGGNGALPIGILKANPHLRGIVFDQPDAADRARKQIAESGLADRCAAVDGDFFKEVPPTAPTSTFSSIVGGVYPPRIDESLASRGAAANDVNMLVHTGGRQRSEAEFRALYNTAGFELLRIMPTEARVSVIEGFRA
jgi:orsellinic acid C2-O-methyltransferase